VVPTNGLPGLVVAVVLSYNQSPQLTAAPSALTFNYQVGGASNIVQKNINLSSGSGPVLNFLASASTNNGGQQWLLVSPTAGATPGTLTVTVNPAGLPIGPYQGMITIIAVGASTPNITVQVNLNVSSQPLLDLSTNSLSFSYQVGGALPVDQFITPNGTTPGMAYTVAVNTNNTGNWLTINASGITPAPVDVNVNPIGLPAGSYPATITFNALNGGNNPQVVNLTLTVSTVSTLSAAPSALTFNYEIGFNAPGSQTVSVTGNGGALAFNVTANQTNTSNNVNWLLTGPPSSNTTPGTFTVAVSPAGMAAGQYTGTVTV